MEKGQIYINEKEYPLEPGSSLYQVLASAGLEQKKGMAVALNQKVVARADWPGIKPNSGDKVLVIIAAQGG